LDGNIHCELRPTKTPHHDHLALPTCVSGSLRAGANQFDARKHWLTDFHFFSINGGACSNEWLSPWPKKLPATTYRGQSADKTKIAVITHDFLGSTPIFIFSFSVNHYP